MSVSAFKFPQVSKRLPPYVVENVVDLWCVRQGAIRYVSSNERMWHVYVDVKEWLPGGFEMRDKLAALKAKGKFEKKDIPIHPLKFGRYLMVCPSYTLAEHEAHVQTVAAQAAQPPGWGEPHPIPPSWDQAQNVPSPTSVVVNHWQEENPPVMWSDAPRPPLAGGWDVELLD